MLPRSKILVSPRLREDLPLQPCLRRDLSRVGSASSPGRGGRGIRVSQGLGCGVQAREAGYGRSATGSAITTASAVQATTAPGGRTRLAARARPRQASDGAGRRHGALRPR